MKELKLTPKQKILVKKLEQDWGVQLEGVYLEHGERIWKWKANKGRLPWEKES